MAGHAGCAENSPARLKGSRSAMGIRERAIRTARVADHRPWDHIGKVPDGDQPARKNHSCIAGFDLVDFPTRFFTESMSASELIRKPLSSPRTSPMATARRAQGIPSGTAGTSTHFLGGSGPHQVERLSLETAPGSFTCAREMTHRADSDRKTRWNRGPVNCTPTSFSPNEAASRTWTTRPDVAKSASPRREA